MQITTTKLRTFIHTAVREELQDLLQDPDLGLSLRATVGKRLLRSKRSQKEGRIFSADNVIARLQLNV